eukprot:6574017-Prymnesium_polylepis.1
MRATGAEQRPAVDQSSTPHAPPELASAAPTLAMTAAGASLSRGTESCGGRAREGGKQVESSGLAG